MAEEKTEAKPAEEKKQGEGRNNGNFRNNGRDNFRRGNNSNFKRESPEERQARESQERLDNWVPKTVLGKAVMAKKIKTLDEIFKSGVKIMEPEIVDSLVKLKVDLLNIGQAKGKFGGGKRRAWRQTQKKTKEGNIATFAVMAVVGNEDGLMGLGFGRAKETLPAKEKAIRKAKLNIQKIERGCSSYDCSCEETHSIPLTVEGKCSSVKVKLMPAPQGTGLAACDEIKKILSLAGIKDIYSKTHGKTGTTINTAKATLDALNKLSKVKL
jgi:small subunit ribosomal protein S5